MKFGGDGLGSRHFAGLATRVVIITEEALAEHGGTRRLEAAAAGARGAPSIACGRRWPMAWQAYSGMSSLSPSRAHRDLSWRHEKLVFVKRGNA